MEKIKIIGDDDMLTKRVEPVQGSPYISPKNIIQRPKVVKSESTGQYHVRYPGLLNLQRTRVNMSP